MKSIPLLALAALLGLTLVQAEESAEALFDAKCAMCHIKTQPTDFNSMVAPPVMGVMMHVKMRYPEKEEAVKFVTDYVLHPDKEKAVCMPQKIRRFGLMPSQQGNVTPEELKTIAEWMYDNYPPQGFRGRGMMGQQTPPPKP